LLKLTVPGPLDLLHAPVPVPGVFPPSEPETSPPQMFCVPPTVAVVGGALTVTLAVVEVAAEHTPLVMAAR